jgi:hypothetical protein
VRAPSASAAATTWSQDWAPSPPASAHSTQQPNHRMALGYRKRRGIASVHCTG